MTRFDAFIRKVPGSVGVKVFVATAALVGLAAVPIFGPKKKGRQGEDYFSSDRPESIRADQERARKEAREARVAAKEQAKSQ